MFFVSIYTTTTDLAVCLFRPRRQSWTIKKNNKAPLPHDAHAAVGGRPQISDAAFFMGSSVCYPKHGFLKKKHSAEPDENPPFDLHRSR